MKAPLFSAGPSALLWEITLVITVVLLLLNVLVILLVHGRRIRQHVRGSRERRFEPRIEAVLATLDRPTSFRDRVRLRYELAGFDGAERPQAALALIERLRAAEPEERRRILDVLRVVGAGELVVRSTRSRIPWRRALAVRTLGWIGGAEAVPVLTQRIGDRNEFVREAAVRALGRLGDEQVLPQLDELFREPGSIPAGVVYDALVAFGSAAAPTFTRALRSEHESVRVASCYGLAATSDAAVARAELTALLDDPASPVRAASAEALGQVGGGLLPDGLAGAARDQVATVRVAATRALGFYDDKRAVQVAHDALVDPDRDTVVCAAEALIRLTRRPVTAAAAQAALARSAAAWPVQRALVMDSVGAV